jgi:hypothetical protein
MNEHLDKMANIRMQKALDSLRGCNNDDLERALLLMIGDVHIAGVNTMQSPIEKELNAGSSPDLVTPDGQPVSLPIVRVPPADHIYGDFSLIRERVRPFSPLCCIETCSSGSLYTFEFLTVG